MGLADRQGIQRLLAAVAAAGATLLAAPADASAGHRQQPKADLTTTGNDSERKRAVPISTAPFEKERVAMSLGPDELPPILPGDTIRVSAEVQVSTTCVQRGPRCVGRGYEFNPFVTARLLLSSGPELVYASAPLGEPQQIKCTQRRPNRNHHCTIAFGNADFAVGQLAAPNPCPSGECFVHLAVGAWNRKARPGNRVVLGADRPDGGIAQDKGRLNVVRLEPGTPAPLGSFSNTLVNDSLPLTEGKLVKRRVIHSVQIPAPIRGEVLTFDASYVATITELPFNTFISTRVIVTDSPTSIQPSGVAKSATILRGQATESNGFNCTQGPSGFRDPCTIVKAGATRIARDPVDDSGNLAPVYVNLVGAAKALLPKRVRPHQRVGVTPLGGLSVSRFLPG